VTAVLPRSAACWIRLTRDFLAETEGFKIARTVSVLIESA
jgi:hypothetical protein